MQKMDCVQKSNIKFETKQTSIIIKMNLFFEMLTSNIKMCFRYLMDEGEGYILWKNIQKNYYVSGVDRKYKKIEKTWKQNLDRNQRRNRNEEKLHTETQFRSILAMGFQKKCKWSNFI